MDNLATKSSLSALRNTLQTMPTKLEDTYNQIMERIAEQNTDDANLASRILSWLTYSVRPLRVHELQHALLHDPRQGIDDILDFDSLVDKEVLLSVCAGLVTLEEETSLVRFIDYTTQEYLQRVRDQRFPKAKVNITRACIAYIRDSGRHRIDDKSRDQMFGEFWFYASDNWERMPTMYNRASKTIFSHFYFRTRHFDLRRSRLSKLVLRLDHASRWFQLFFRWTA